MAKKRQVKAGGSSEWAKTETLLIRLHPDDKARFKEAADYAGVALSVWVRERLRSTARRELEEAKIFAPLKRRD